MSFIKSRCAPRVSGTSVSQWFNWIVSATERPPIAMAIFFASLG